MFLEVLRLLSHQDFVSGEYIARRLGCSRATIHNAIQAANKVGVVVHAVQGRGYRLAGPLDWLRPASFTERLEAAGFHFHYFESLPSTNSYLRVPQGGSPSHGGHCRVADPWAWT